MSQDLLQRKILREDKDELREYKGKWKLFRVCENTKTLLGETVFDSEKEALEHIMLVEKCVLKGNANGKLVVSENNAIVWPQNAEMFKDIARKYGLSPYIAIDMFPIPIGENT